jgi:hypothetical protein
VSSKAFLLVDIGSFDARKFREVAC